MGDVHDTSYYLKCMMGGVMACGATHALICPLDIVKCRKQVRKCYHHHHHRLLSLPISTSLTFLVTIG
jgi:hypothetical protein